MDVEITYDVDDWQKFQSYLEKDITKNIKTKWDGFIVNMILWMIIGAVGMSVFRYFDKFHWPSAGYTTIVFIIISALFFRHVHRIKKAFAPSELGAFVGTHRFTITESGIKSQGNGYSGENEWKSIIKVVRDTGLIMLFVDTANAFIFPENKLNNPDLVFNHVNECNKNLNQIQEPNPVLHASNPT